MITFKEYILHITSIQLIAFLRVFIVILTLNELLRLGTHSAAALCRRRCMRQRGCASEQQRRGRWGARAGNDTRLRRCAARPRAGARARRRGANGWHWHNGGHHPRHCYSAAALRRRGGGTAGNPAVAAAAADTAPAAACRCAHWRHAAGERGASKRRLALRQRSITQGCRSVRQRRVSHGRRALRQRRDARRR